MVKLAASFVALPSERRSLAFAQTAARMSASSVMVEKDFWVCWLLGLLFADPESAPHLVFKGGTSLSKVYGVIDRFSETSIFRFRRRSSAPTKPRSKQRRVGRSATRLLPACKRPAVNARASC